MARELAIALTSSRGFALGNRDPGGARSSGGRTRPGGWTRCAR